MLCYQLLHFPLCLAAPCIKPLLLYCTECRSPQALWPCLEMLLLLKDNIQSPSSASFHFSENTPCYWAGREKPSHFQQKKILNLKKILLNTKTCKHIAPFQGNSNFSWEFGARGWEAWCLTRKGGKKQTLCKGKSVQTQKERWENLQMLATTTLHDSASRC